MSKILSFQLFARNTAYWSIALLFFASAFSRSLFSIGMGLFVVGWFFSGKWGKKWVLIKQNPAIALFIIMLFWMFLSITWSWASISGVQTSLRVQYRLLLIPMIATLPMDIRWMKRYWYAFALGITVLLLHIYLIDVIEMPWINGKNTGGVFFSPLSQCIGVAIFTCWCLHEIINSKHLKIFRIILFVLWILATNALLFLSIQRAGYLAFLIGSIFILFNKLPSVKLKQASIVFFIFCFLLLSITENTIKKRTQSAIEEVINYTYVTDYTSVGARLHMWYVSAKAIQEKPVIGYGLGSYPVVSKRGFQDNRMCGVGCVHPHNYYFYFMLEYGGIGILLFALAIAAMLRNTMYRNKEVTLSMVILIFILASLTDTTLAYRGTMYLFAPFFGVIMAHSCNKDNDYE